MIKMLNIAVKKAVAYRISGVITDEDMLMVLSEIKKSIELYGEVYLYQEIESVGGVEPSAIIDKIKFLFGVGISDITKVAIVTDNAWIQKIIVLEDKILSKMTLKSFPLESREEAIEFLLAS